MNKKNEITVNDLIFSVHTWNADPAFIEWEEDAQELYDSIDTIEELSESDDLEEVLEMLEIGPCDTEWEVFRITGKEGGYGYLGIQHLNPEI